MTELSTAKRVARGANLLDAKRPNWFNEVNTNTLCQTDGRVCVLGQVYGDYNTGSRTLSMDDIVERANHGFTNTESEPDSSFEADTEEWKRVIHERRCQNGATRGTERTTTSHVITLEDIEKAKEVIGNAITPGTPYVQNLTEAGILFHVMDILGVLGMVE